MTYDRREGDAPSPPRPSAVPAACAHRRALARSSYRRLSVSRRPTHTAPVDLRGPELTHGLRGSPCTRYGCRHRNTVRSTSCRHVFSGGHRTGGDSAGRRGRLSLGGLIVCGPSATTATWPPSPSGSALCAAHRSIRASRLPTTSPRRDEHFPHCPGAANVTRCCTARRTTEACSATYDDDADFASSSRADAAQYEAPKSRRRSLDIGRARGMPRTASRADFAICPILRAGVGCSTVSSVNPWRESAYRPLPQRDTLEPVEYS